uniref:Metalloendopeptidase n=1 Tax=Strongyloides papillosus TaxID=174720 RepID=A0A0N5CHI4_STREA
MVETITFKKVPPYPIMPNIVKLYISKSLDSEKIYNQLFFLSYTSCLDFHKQNTSNKHIGINFFSTQRKSKVILSTSLKRPTNVYLKKSVLHNEKHLAFYVGLALGLIPEVIRSDRNEHIKIHWKNILKSYKKYYKKEPYNEKYLTNTGFDFSSVMIYNPYYGSKNGKQTFVSKLYPYYEKVLNIFKHFSYNDIKRINYMYCGNICRKENQCLHGGYFIKTCDGCRCPLGFIGNKCENIDSEFDKCSPKNNFLAYSFKKNLLIKNISRFCMYSIKSKKGRKVRITILNTKLSKTNSCDKGIGMEIKYGKDKAAKGLLLCNNYKNIEIPAISSEIYIIFSDYYPNNLLKLSYNEVK